MLLATLFLDEVTQLALHRFESVVDHFVERLMRTVIFLLLVGHELVPRAYCHIDPATIGISFVMSVISLLDRDVAPVDVIAKFVEPRSVSHYEVIELI